MFVAGTSTHKVGEVAQTLLGVAPSASTISRLNQSLTQQFDTWRQRPLQEHWRVLYLDGVHFRIRQWEKANFTIILTCAGYLGHLFTKSESRASTMALISHLAFMKRRTGQETRE